MRKKLNIFIMLTLTIFIMTITQKAYAMYAAGETKEDWESNLISSIHGTQNILGNEPIDIPNPEQVLHEGDPVQYVRVLRPIYLNFPNVDELEAHIRARPDLDQLWAHYQLRHRHDNPMGLPELLVRLNLEI